VSAFSLERSDSVKEGTHSSRSREGVRHAVADRDTLEVDGRSASLDERLVSINDGGSKDGQVSTSVRLSREMNGSTLKLLERLLEGGKPKKLSTCLG
jgi:hypothetical protein